MRPFKSHYADIFDVISPSFHICSDESFFRLFCQGHTLPLLLLPFSYVLLLFSFPAPERAKEDADDEEDGEDKILARFYMVFAICRF